MLIENNLITCLFSDYGQNIHTWIFWMFAKPSSNNDNKLSQWVSKSIHYENSLWKFFITCFIVVWFIEYTWKHDFFQGIIANKILEILTFFKSVKYLNSVLKLIIK